MVTNCLVVVVQVNNYICINSPFLAIARLLRQAVIANAEEGEGLGKMIIATTALPQ